MNTIDKSDWKILRNNTSFINFDIKAEKKLIFKNHKKKKVALKGPKQMIDWE